jgi:hypothetical protein
LLDKNKNKNMNALLKTRVRIVVAIGLYDYRTVVGDQFEVNGLSLVIHRKVKARFVATGFAVSDPKTGFMLASGNTKELAVADLKRRFEQFSFEQICVMLARCPKAPIGAQEVYARKKLTNVNSDLVTAIVDTIAKEAELDDAEKKVVQSVLVPTGNYAGTLTRNAPVKRNEVKSAVWNALQKPKKRQTKLVFTNEFARNLFNKLAYKSWPESLDRSNIKLV